MSIERNPIVRFVSAQAGDRVVVHLDGEVISRVGDDLYVELSPERLGGSSVVVKVPMDEVWLAKPTPEMLELGMTGQPD